jgi:exopolyphosphatase/guanosine-5'-triphosphate,3'-diphosphate pyrophosphatase
VPDSTRETPVTSSSDDEIRALIGSIGLTLPDTDHAERCGRFAARIFDGLHTFLDLPEHDRLITIAAATFHDVGYLRGGRDHHRKSFDILREATTLPFSADDRLVVAAAARYHGHTSPNIEHAGFGEMSFEDQRRVRRVAAIVRLAAALDASHLGVISDVDAEVGENGARVIAIAAVEPPLERDRLREAAGGFMHLTQRRVDVDVVHERS